MPDDPQLGIVHAIERLLAHGGLGLSPAQRKDIYTQLLHRTGAAGRAPDQARTGSDFARAADRDFLRWERDEPAPTGADPIPGTDPVPATVPAAATRRHTPKKTVPRVALVQLYDADGMITPGTQASVRERIARTLDAVDTMTAADTGRRGWLAKTGFRFEVSWRDGEPNAAAKAATPPLSYPIYVYPDDKSAARLVQALDDHGYPARTPGTELVIRDHVRNDWGSRLRGTAAPPGTGVASFKKCAFIKTAVFKEGGTDPTLIANAILHEFGHLCNIIARKDAHPNDGSIMQTNRTASQMMATLRTYNPAHAAKILDEVARQWGIAVRI